MAQEETNGEKINEASKGYTRYDQREEQVGPKASIARDSELGRQAPSPFILPPGI